MSDDAKEKEPQPADKSVPAEWENKLFDTLQSIESDYGQFKSNMESLRENLKGFVENTEESLSRMKEETRKKVDQDQVEKKVKSVKGKITDIDHKVHDVMDEIGYGESLDVSKIPPGILESVYESTLDDVVKTMRHNLGDHDTHRIVSETLEMMRSRTSGSELFQFDGRRIKVRNLVNSIEQKLISAKQVHSTYTELLNKMVENIPGYQPKNFRAMMKSKSLEFAIDKTTSLLRRVNKLEDSLSSNSQMLQSLMNRVNSAVDQIDGRMTNVEEKVTQNLEEKSEVLERKLDAFESRFTEIEKVWDDVEELKEGAEKHESLEQRFNELSASYEMKVTTLENEIERLKDEIPEEKTVTDKMDEEERFVYYSLPADGGTISKIEGLIGDVVSDVEKRLESLVDKGIVAKEQRGRWEVYARKDEGFSVETSELEAEEEPEVEVDEADLVLSKIPEDGCTLARLNREIEEMDEDEIEEVLQILIDEDQVFTVKRNRWTIYMKGKEPKEVT